MTLTLRVDVPRIVFVQLFGVEIVGLPPYRILMSTLRTCVQFFTHHGGGGDLSIFVYIETKKYLHFFLRTPRFKIAEIIKIAKKY